MKVDLSHGSCNHLVATTFALNAQKVAQVAVAMLDDGNRWWKIHFDDEREEWNCEPAHQELRATDTVFQSNGSTFEYRQRDLAAEFGVVGLSLVGFDASHEAGRGLGRLMFADGSFIEFCETYEDHANTVRYEPQGG